MIQVFFQSKDFFVKLILIDYLLDVRFVVLAFEVLEVVLARELLALEVLVIELFALFVLAFEELLLLCVEFDL